MEHDARRPHAVTSTYLSSGIEVVTDNWVIDVFEMDPDLMRTAGFGIKLNERAISYQLSAFRLSDD